MKRWWKIGLRVLAWGCLAAVVGLFVMSTKQALSYSSVCTRCLATRSGVERSILGIPYEDKHRETLYLYATAEVPRPAKYSEGRQTIYEQIYGKACGHDFARIGFCRYGWRGVGCGTFGRYSEVRSRNELISGAFGAFERIRDKELAARSCQLIEREFPLKRPPRTGEQNLVKEAEERAERYRRMSLLGDLLGLVRNKGDWAMVLDYVAGGFQGDPPLISEVAAVVGRLESGQSAGNATAAGVLAMRSSTSNELLERMMKDGDRETAWSAKFHVIRGKRLELFGLALVDYELSDPLKLEIRRYTTEDFRRLLALEDPRVDLLCENAIWCADTDHFALLDPMLAALNRNDSPSARDTIERMLRGGNPYHRGGIPVSRSPVHNPEYRWNDINTMRKPVEEMRKTVTANWRGADIGMSMKFYEAVKGIGETNDRKQWSFLKEIYIEGSNVWAMAVLGRALHQLDAQKTESLLIYDLRNGRRVPGAIFAMGFIGSGNFAPVLEEFAARPRPTPLLKDHLPKNYYDADGDGTALLTYALHRCHGIPTWKLVKNTEGRYVIEKPPEVPR